MNASETPVCGIIMPISAMEPDYAESHWAKVRKIIERAIVAAEMTPQAVWENQNNDVIHGKILKNIYENEVIVCDCSGKNPNVMLEVGMRLTTKKPTVLIADTDTKLPFDTGSISHCLYPRDLDYLAVDAFIATLSKAISEIYAASLAGSYTSFVENFRFETVTPPTVAISADEYQAQNILKILQTMQTLDEKMSSLVSPVVAFGAPVKLSSGYRIFGGETTETELGNKGREDLYIGQRVFHQKFGNGEIIEIDGNKLEIMFDSSGQKRCMDSFVTIIKD